MRFRLTTLLVAVAMIAITCAAVLYRNRWWMDGIVTITILLYVVVGLRAIGLRGSSRVVAITFAITGPGYLFLATLAMLTAFPDVLVTNVLLAIASKNIGAELGSYSLESILKSLGNKSLRQDYLSVFIIGHCVFSWLFAVLAAWFAGRIYNQPTAVQNSKSSPS
jgi:hypothetical protein